MRRSTAGFILTLALGTLTAPLAADAQPAGKVARIGFLGARSASDTSPQLDAFRQRLREIGWVEGLNIVIESRYAEGRYERFSDLAAELVRLKADVIFAHATAAAQAAQRATTTIPIVFANVGDPVGSGLVASLARPGGNITGLAFFAGLEIMGKQLQLLKEAVPKVSKVAVLWNSANPSHARVVRETEVAARSLGVQLQLLQARSPNEFDSAFAAMTRGRAGALMVIADPMFLLHRRRLADLAAKGRLPAMHGLAEHVEAGGLLAYAPDINDLFRRAATYVDKILKGAKPADLPVEQPTKFELVINLKTAKALGLTLPPSVLIRADQVIQ